MQKFFTLSIGFHLALFSLFFAHLNLARHDNIGTHEKIIAYMYQQQPSVHSQKKSSPLPIKEQAQQNNTAQSRATTGSKNQPAEQTLGESNELLTSLHNKIEAEINRSNFSSYPQKIYVAFTLFPDGHIENIRCLESSESASLNLAVIKAVSAIQPVAIARNFLSVPRELKITVVFGATM